MGNNDGGIGVVVVAVTDLAVFLRKRLSVLRRLGQQLGCLELPFAPVVAALVAKAVAEASVPVEPVRLPSYVVGARRRCPRKRWDRR